MSKNKSYIHLFDTTAEFEALYYTSGYTEPWVSFTKDSNRIAYNRANGHEYVDLGLPSGRLWATMNIGASTPEEYGNYYAWGEISTKDDYTWQTYAYGAAQPFSKYDTDGRTKLEFTDDIASIEWGGGWRIPTEADLQELTANTTSVWDASKSGMTFTSNINGNSIFIPAGGYYDGAYRLDAGALSNIWASNVNTIAATNAFRLYFDFNSGSLNVGNRPRYYGRNVRGVL